MVGLTTGNRLVTAPVGLEFLTKQGGSLDVIVPLLSAVKDAKSESSQLAALESMEAFFLGLLRAGGLKAAVIDKRSCGASEMYDGEERAHWAGEAYSAFVNELLDLLAKTGVARAVHVGSKSPITNIVGVLESQFFQFADVRYFTYLNTRKLAVDRTLAREDDTPEPHSLQMFVRNLYELLSHLPTTLKGDSGQDDCIINKASDKSWCPPLSMTRNNRSSSDEATNQMWSDAVIQKEVFVRSWRAFVRLSQPLGARRKDYGQSVSSCVLSTANMSTVSVPGDSFLTSLSDEVDERLKQMATAVCKEPTNVTNPDRQSARGQKADTSEWMLSSAEGKEADDDDDDDDDDDEDEDEDDEEEEEDDDDNNKVDAGEEEEEDVEGEEEEADDEEADDDDNADDNADGEDDDGEEEGEDDVDGDEDGEEEQEEDDDEDGEQDAEEEDDDDAEGESEEDVEPPKKKRK